MEHKVHELGWIKHSAWLYKLPAHHKRKWGEQKVLHSESLFLIIIFCKTFTSTILDLSVATAACVTSWLHLNEENANLRKPQQSAERHFNKERFRSKAGHWEWCHSFAATRKSTFRRHVSLLLNMLGFLFGELSIFWKYWDPSYIKDWTKRSTSE